MRILRGIGIFMIILVVFTLLLVGYFFLTAEVSIVGFKTEGVQAADVPETFEKIKTSVEDNTFQGTLFQSGTIGPAENYALITYTVTLSNQCLVPIDMIEVQVVPEPTDVLQVGDHAEHYLQAKSQGDVTATLLMPKDSHTVREIIVTYYVWGVSFSIKETYGI